MALSSPLSSLRLLDPSVTLIHTSATFIHPLTTGLWALALRIAALLLRWLSSSQGDMAQLSKVGLPLGLGTGRGDPPLGGVRYLSQVHSHFLQGVVGLLGVAAATRRNDVLPLVLPTPRLGEDVV